MFAERFNTLMNIAEVSNSSMSRQVNIHSSQIGRLRSGARPLPKHHKYLSSICMYLAIHIKKDYQIDALKTLTGITDSALYRTESLASYLEYWLLEDEKNSDTRLISGGPIRTDKKSNSAAKIIPYFYGNAGKRKAVEQLLSNILQEDHLQTLYLFSDENMLWLYEDPSFCKHWLNLFEKVLRKGNRVIIIHNISRDMNEMVIGIMKWLPLYLTGKVEPYYYARLRDGLFHRSMFLGPKTGAIISSSIQQKTEEMLNLYLTDKTALQALEKEYMQYFSLCKPLMQIYRKEDLDAIQKISLLIADADGESWFSCAMPPLFTMSEHMIQQLTEENKNENLHLLWQRSIKIFQKMIHNNRITLYLLNPEIALKDPKGLNFPLAKFFSLEKVNYSVGEYLNQIEYLKQLEKIHSNLSVRFIDKIEKNVLIYVQEETGVIIATADDPITAFIIREKTLVHAYGEYMRHY